MIKLSVSSLHRKTALKILDHKEQLVTECLSSVGEFAQNINEEVAHDISRATIQFYQVHIYLYYYMSVALLLG